MRMKWMPVLLLALITLSCSEDSGHPARAIRESMEESLADVLDRWYPASVDTTYGGFFSTFTYDFKLTGPQDKMIVTQARHTWTNAKAFQRFRKEEYKQFAAHGFHFLKNAMWDKQFGGFYTLVDRQGNVKDREALKTAYGNSFGIFALAAYYEASRDTAALQLAREAFLWLEAHSHDPVNKGYYQHITREGQAVQRTPAIATTEDTGYKDQNSSIHLLEAFTELYKVWPDSLVRIRLTEMLELIRDTITTPRGNLTLFLTPDWQPVTFADSSEEVILRHRHLDHVSFGHDVETAYLMLEASEMLGLENDTTTQRIAKHMVDHALQHGWDPEMGGFYDEGYYFSNSPSIRIIKDTKNWWAQAEGLNTLLLMSQQYPNDPQEYFSKFVTLWNYVDAYLIDHENGDWYGGGIDKEPDQKRALKGHIWKGVYHHYRGLTNCIDRLRKMEDQP